MTKKDQSDNLDRVIRKEQSELSTALVRGASALAKERIHEQLINSSKRKASVLEEERVKDDGIYIDSCEESVGTLIKKAALNSYKDYHSLDYDEKSVVALELMEFYSYVFSKDVDTTETDAVVKVWSPMLERLFRRIQLRTKWYGGKNHSVDYRYDTRDSPSTGPHHLREHLGDSGDSSDNLGFKVDLRVVKDSLSRRKKEADKANCEISRIDPGLVKITNDRTKLLLESKAVLDKIVEEDPGRAKEISVPALQLIGNHAILYSLSLAANGLYAGLKEGSAYVPNVISNMDSFRDVILLLFKFKAATTNILAFGLKGGDDGGGNNNNSDNNSSSNNSNNCTSWVRDTWVPPGENLGCLLI
ncbi:hypothetical protein [Parasitella parasitica]|uniref:Uncharacterized protein n=1 Tax=Parasitella parasitica TaxID=35722 RepID=A0A0B7NEG8_9FUNG|nr:hypothetical protein [Parasitella parasitica]